MLRTISKRIPRRALCIMMLVCVAAVAFGQTPSVAPLESGSVIRLRVKLVDGPGTKARGLQRKRFFLIKGSLEANRELIRNIEQRSVISRDCYYRSIGASEALIAWLRKNDCESVYCREVELKDLEGPEAVPEFQQAAMLGEKEFGSRELARKWLTVNLKDELRSGYYKLQQRELQALLRHAEELSKAKVQSVMTDTNGTAFFTGVEPGAYVISNILPTEIGSVAAVWNCSIEVKAGDLEKPFLLANSGNKDKNNKCPSGLLERPLPDCPAASKSVARNKATPQPKQAGRGRIQ